MSESQQAEIMRNVDDAGADMPLPDWIDFLENLAADIEARLEGARADLENADG